MGQPSFGMLDLGLNMRFRTVREDRIDKLHYVIWEGFGSYSVNHGKIDLKYSSMSRTLCHEELGPSVSFLKVPPSPKEISFSSLGANNLVLTDASGSFAYSPNDWDGIKTVDGEAEGIWWKPKLFEELFGKSTYKSSGHIHRTSRR